MTEKHKIEVLQFSTDEIEELLKGVARAALVGRMKPGGWFCHQSVRRDDYGNWEVRTEVRWEVKS